MNLNDEVFDTKESYECKSSYIICSIPRSGSSLLSYGLTETKIAGIPHEYFNIMNKDILMPRWNLTTIEEYIAVLLKKRVTANGWFSLKIHYHQYYENFLHHAPDKIFPNLKYIYITRRDNIRQSISYLKSIQSGKWTSLDQEYLKPAFDYKRIKGYQSQMDSEEKGWETYFKQKEIEPLRIIYEDFVLSYSDTILKVLNFLGIEIPETLQIAAPKIQKQADDLTENWYQLFLTHEAPEKTLRQANLALEKDNFLEAENLFSLLCQYDTSNPEYQYYLGITQFNQEKYDPALNSFFTGLKQGLLNSDICNYLGKCLERIGEKDTAELFFKQAKELLN